MDEFREQLLRRIAGYQGLQRQLQDRLSELEEELASVERRLAAAAQLYEVEFGSAVSTPQSEESSLDTDAPGDMSQLSWADAMEKVLLAAERPMHVREVWARLQAGGFKTDSRDPLRSIVSIAIRKPQFVRVGRNIYGVQGHGESRFDGYGGTPSVNGSDRP